MNYINKIGYLSFIIIVVLSACRKDEISSGTIFNAPQPAVFHNGSVTGTVVDENDEPIANALVTIDPNSFTTDDNGYFHFKNVTLNSKGSLIKVEKQGYFYSAKLVNAELNSENFTKVKLIEKIQVGNISSTIGGTVSTDDGATISFSDNSISYQNGGDYSGIVDVYATWLDPTDRSLVERMPGDLRAFDTEGDQVQLATYGMLGIELQSQSGEELNIKNGETASLEFPIPDELLANAPSTIPLWHFDEATGYWIEEGQAELIGNKYIGTVSHFSFWNCDVPIDYVFIEGDVINESGGIQNLLVEISLASNAMSGYDYTNQNGVYSGFIPADEQLILSIYDYCNNLLYSENIGPFDTDVILPTIVLDNNQYYITGSLICNGATIDNGYVSISSGSLQTVLSTNSTGNFSGNISLCAVNEISVQAYDVNNATQSEIQIIDISGTNQLDLGQIVVCDEAEEYILINLDGIDYGFFEPHFESSTETNIGATEGDAQITIRYVGVDTGMYTPSLLYFTDFNSAIDSTVCYGTGCNTISLDVTEYINPGGNIVGTFIGDIPSIDGLKPISGSFKVKTDE